MAKYLIRMPALLRAFFPSLSWRVKTNQPVVYLTFDDGPTPEITEWTLSQLRKYNAKATFFLIGKNVDVYPEILEAIKADDHSIGNHTQNHYNGWNRSTKEYLENVANCSKRVDSNLFRPPYGRLKPSQIHLLKKQYKIIMWDVLSGDFDIDIDGEQCFNNVIDHIRPGSIIVFHDSKKAWPRLQEALPRTLEYLQKKGFRMEAL